MAIIYTPFEELFASEYQLTYISTDGHIDVGPNTYSVFHYYTIQERQIIFQVCEKHLPWEHTQEQEQWERTMYMYQYIIKSPSPFPYSEYPLSEEIIMAITWTPTIQVINIDESRVKFSATRLNTETNESRSYSCCGIVAINQHKRDMENNVWSQYQEALAIEAANATKIGNWLVEAKNNLEAKEM